MAFVRSAAQAFAAKASQLESHIAKDWLDGWTAAEIPDLRGKVALVTGGNSGIGFEAVRKLAENGAQVLLVSRDHKNGVDAANKIRADVGKDARIEVLQCDMSSLKDVADLASHIRSTTRQLDILVLNAGVFHPGPFAMTPDGIEQTLGVNYYAHALLTLSLLDLLRATPSARVVLVSSEAEAYGKVDWSNLTGHKFKDSGMMPYSTSKLYMIMLARELSVRVPEVDFLCVHPGLVATPLQHKASWRYWTAAVVTTAAALLGQQPRHGAYSLLYAATTPELKGLHWGYWGPNSFNLWPTTRREPASQAINNPVSCWKLFEQTVAVLNARLAKGDRTLAGVPPHPDDFLRAQQHPQQQQPQQPHARHTPASHAVAA